MREHKFACLHNNIIMLHSDINILHVCMIMLHVDTNKSHLNIITLHDDIISFMQVTEVYHHKFDLFLHAFKVHI